MSILTDQEQTTQQLNNAVNNTNGGINTITQTVETIRQLKQQCKLLSQSASEEEKVTKRRQIIELVVQLKLLNWECYSIIDSNKEDIFEIKRQSDLVLLDIQNIQYQHKQLRKQIDEYNSYQNKMDQLDLLSEEEFLEENADLREQLEGGAGANEEEEQQQQQQEVEKMAADESREEQGGEEKEKEKTETSNGSSAAERHAEPLAKKKEKAMTRHELQIARLKDEEQRRLDLFIEKNSLQELKSKLASQVKTISDKVSDKETLNKMLTKYIVDDSANLRRYLS